MSSDSTQHAVVVREAIQVVLRRLSDIPSTPDVDGLLRKAGDCLREAERWGRSPPTRQERERLLNRILLLHAEVTELEPPAP